MQTKRTVFKVFVTLLIATLLFVALPEQKVAADTAVVYDAIPATLPPSMASLGFQATSTSEFGDYVHLGGVNRELQDVTVTMVAWAYQSNWPTYTDPAGWDHPITLNLYNAIPGTPNQLGSLIATKTATFKIPWRPEPDTTGTCTDDKWLAPDDSCNSGYAFNITFDFSSLDVTLPDDIIIGVKYNTNTHGDNPIGTSGPFESLNVGAQGSAIVGTDDNTDNVFWDTDYAGFYTDSGAAGVGVFREDTAWSPYGTIPFQVTAAPPPPVYVDDDLVCGGNTPCYATINEGINAAPVGGTVIVYPGTYTENITINKPLSLLGDGRDTTTIQGVAPVTDSGSFTIAASDVTVDGFEILGIGQKLIRITQTVENVQFFNNRVIGAENTGSAGGWALFESNYNLNQTDLVIDNNIFVGNNASTLVYLNPQLINLVFTNNTFTGTMMPNGLVVGMDGLDGNQVITGNTFDIESTYALFEAFGTYDIVGIFDANTWRDGYIATGNKVALASLVYPSTNDINRTNGWAHVNVVSVDKDAGTMTVEFVQPRDFYACFEYRTDGDISQATGNANYNTEVLDGLYPYTCLSTISNVKKTFNLNQYIEIRHAFGGEKDERFYWTRFDLVTDLWVCPTGDCGHEGLEFASIQEAIDAAYGGATIHVMAGTYNDVGGNTIPVEKQGLTIVLEDGVVVENNSPAFIINADYTTITTTSLLGAKLVPTNGSNAIDVAGGLTNIILEGFEIDGADGTNGIDFDGVVTDLVIRDNYIHSLAGDGIYFAAQPAGTVQIQGNLLMGNGGNGIEAGTYAVPAQYNAWGHVDGAALGDGASENVDWVNWTHVDLYLESSGTVNPNQVVTGSTITYEVKANLSNVMGADFVLHYPAEFSIASTTLGDLFDLETLTPDTNQLRFEGWQMGSETTNPGEPLSGEDLILFTVTFNADTANKGLLLDLDETSDLFSMAPGYGPSTNIYATALVGVEDLEVIDLPTLAEDDLDRDYIAGLEEFFEISVNNPSEGGEFTNVLFNFTIKDALLADIYAFQYPDGSGGWLDMPLTQVGNDVVGYFGPSAGFPMGAPYSATTQFRIVFYNPGDYDVVITLDDLTMNWELAKLENTVSVLGNYTVTGTVSMQGRSVRSGVPITLTAITVPVYGPFNTNSTNVISNNVLFTGVNWGTYEVTTNQARYLNVHEELNKQFDVTDNTLLAALELKGGNAIWADNVINIQDASKVSSDYGKTIDTDGDVNFDGVVNIQDLALVGGNFDLTSEVAYGTWTP